MAERFTPPGNLASRSVHLEAPASLVGSFSFESGEDVWEQARRHWLPPAEYLNLPDEPLETPTDSRGLVDIGATIELGKSLVDPMYKWTQRDSTHHFYWFETNFPYSHKWEDEGIFYTAGGFRNLPIHKGELPREFENLLHFITLPIPRPSNEVMQYRIEGWKVARSLFKTTRELVQWERRARRRADYVRDNPWVVANQPDGDAFAQEYMAEIIDHNFAGVQHHLVELERVPRAFRLVEPDPSPDKLAASVLRVGQLVVPRSMQLARAIRDDRPIVLAA